MRPSTSSQTYVCLPCLLKTTRSGRVCTTTGRDPEVSTRRYKSTLSPSNVSQNQLSKSLKHETRPVSITRIKTRSETTDSTPSVRLNNSQISKLGQLHSLRQRLHDGLAAVPEAEGNPQGVPIEKILAAITPKGERTWPYIQTLEQVYSGKLYGEVSEELVKISKHRRPSTSTVQDDATLKILDKLGITNQGEKTTAATKPEPVVSVPLDKKMPRIRKRTTLRLRKIAKTMPIITKAKVALTRKEPVGKQTPQSTRRSLSGPRVGEEIQAAVLHAPSDAIDIDGSLIPQRAIETEELPKVPHLSFDLSRVLFNPGVYHLQDPRSRVFNFDPYLENIMPVTDFNFNALNPYITSSEDDFLRNVSMKYDKRYIGSSSSMSGAMSHFHFLLSAWRPIDPSILSQRITGLRSFTQITRAPSSIFLRWRDGVYAIDADKEYDSPNILMMQGKSMEKLLTLEKEDFEKYRKPKAGESAPAVNNDPEAYHYSSVANFLLRSQLDAYDPRLPGTGMFDLKTRAVAGIRMNMSEHEVGMGYQIKERFGLWESYDREYYDMIRSAFLKYSLQVRMGRMDGIFVAYHNIARIFGFQYISVAELDMALHGQADPTLGNREFRITLKLMNDIFDQATKELPSQSLRFTFETREPTKTHPNGIMNIFAESMTEDQIKEIQKSGKDKVEQYEKDMAKGMNPSHTSSATDQTIDTMLSPSTLESNAADTNFLDKILGKRNTKQEQYSDKERQPAVEAAKEPAKEPVKDRQIRHWVLEVYNEINGRSVPRPTNIYPEDNWVVKYKLQEMPSDKSKASYSVTRNRRAAALVWDVETKKNNYFIDKIRQMSESGRAWREEQDQLDAQRNKIALYSPPTDASRVSI